MILPKQFIELNEAVKKLNTGVNVNVFGENRYLLLQGSRHKGYSLFVVEADSKRIVSALSYGNKSSILSTLDTIERISIYNTKERKG